MRNLKKVLLITIVAVAVIGIVTAVEYVDYVIYKAKYPNTEFWMFLFDSRK